ncbi:unnamed protein product [Dicrocoelium dendriticum]|nr:unnamed protein product [Dicrocoelium dendriticum]
MRSQLMTEDDDCLISTLDTIDSEALNTCTSALDRLFQLQDDCVQMCSDSLWPETRVDESLFRSLEEIRSELQYFADHCPELTERRLELLQEENVLRIPHSQQEELVRVIQNVDSHLFDMSPLHELFQIRRGLRDDLARTVTILSILYSPFVLFLCQKEGLDSISQSLQCFDGALDKVNSARKHLGLGDLR